MLVQNFKKISQSIVSVVEAGERHIHTKCCSGKRRFNCGCKTVLYIAVEFK
jgi:hypothetical protein